MQSSLRYAVVALACASSILMAQNKAKNQPQPSAPTNAPVCHTDQEMNQLRAQLAKTQSDYMALVIKMDNEMLNKTAHENQAYSSEKDIAIKNLESLNPGMKWNPATQSLQAAPPPVSTPDIAPAKANDTPAAPAKIEKPQEKK